MTPVGRAYQEGNMQSHRQHQLLLQRHTRHSQRSGLGDEGGFGSGEESASSIAGSTVSAATEGTTSTSGTAPVGTAPTGGAGRATRDHHGGLQQQKHKAKRRQKNHPRSSHAASTEHSEDDDTQASLSSSIASSLGDKNSSSSFGEGGKTRREHDKKLKELEGRGPNGNGRRRGSGLGGGGAGQGRAKRGASFSAENGLGAVFDEADAHEKFGSAAAPAAGGLSLSRTTPAASSSSGQMHHMFSATVGTHQQHNSYQHASRKRSMNIRDLSSTQLLSGSGWLGRLAEIDREIDVAPLVPLSVKLSTIESFLRVEIMNRVTQRSRALLQGVHQGEATVATAKALLHNTIEDFVDQVEAANSTKSSDLLQLYSGEARLRFKAEVDKRVRAHMEKGGNRRAPVGVRT